MAQALHPDDVTVAIFCALAYESAAVRFTLDEVFKCAGIEGKKYAYHLGRIGDHNVVITRPTDMGLVNAAHCAATVSQQFPNVRFALMVGIGAGIPSPRLDIRLGDVAVSVPGDGHPGVVQYDFGKYEVDDKFVGKGSLNMPPRILISANGSLEEEEYMGESPMEEILRCITTKNPKFKRPSIEDHLFDDSFPHVEKGSNCKACEAASDVKFIHRDQRDSDEPAIHRGLILSGSGVIKNPKDRESLRRGHQNAICFEMEAAGIMNEIPCLVIRGICDYADTHKQDGWHHYAAATAASYCKAILLEVSGEKVVETQRMQEFMEKVNDIHQKVKDTQTVAQKICTSLDFTNIRKWLSTLDPSANCDRAQEQRHEGTGQWFLDSDAYTNWKKERNSILWLHGIPGCGKTILSSSVVADLEANIDSTSLIYFYFDVSDEAKQSIENCIRSLAMQLYSKQKRLRNEIDRLHSLCDEGNCQPSYTSLSGSLRSMLRQANETWIVLDALDECDEENYNVRVFPWISTLHRADLNTHILVTSRPEQYIQAEFASWSPPHEGISIQSSLVEDDINAYIKAQTKAMDRWKDRQDVQEKIESALIEKADRMFRWVSCQIHELNNCLLPNDVDKALRNLPKTLHGTYERILARLLQMSSYREKTIRLFQFLLYSGRPLRVEEAAELVVVDLSKRPRFDPKDRMPIPKEVALFCSSLVVLVQVKDKSSNATVTEIQLAHSSVHDYLKTIGLERGKSLELEEIIARRTIAQVCLSYFLDIDHSKTAQEVREKYHLAEYSSQYWSEHVLAAGTSDPTLSNLINELFSRRNVFELGYQLYQPDRPRGRANPSKETVPALYYASFVGMLGPVQALLERGVDANARGGHYGSAVQAAAFKGHEEIVEQLLCADADVNLSGGLFENALQAASEGGYTRIVHMLLTKNANVNAPRGRHGSALQAASFQGHELVVRQLLQAGANVNLSGGIFGTALQAACEGGHITIVRLLLSKNADMSKRVGKYGYPLQAASLRGREEIIQLLLSSGADIKASGGTYGSALHAASWGGHEQVVQMLCDNGADINAQNGHYGNALRAASSQGHEKVVRLLLQKGAKDTDHGKNCGTVLEAACREGYENITQLLLDFGFDVRMQLGKPRNDPLRAASFGGHKEVVQLLLGRCGNEKLSDEQYSNAVWGACEEGHEEILDLLLESCKDLPGELLGTALLAACEGGFKSIIDSLLDRGADIHAQHPVYGTALQAASRGGYETIVELLLDRGAKVNAQTGRHDSALQVASKEGNLEIVRLLLDNGADVNLKGGCHGSAYKAASSCGHGDVVQLLLDRGADP